MNVEQIAGLVFRTPSGEEFGRIRPLKDGLPQDLQNTNLQAFAEDDCGNYFVAVGAVIGFWDHETSEVQELAPSPAEFIAGLVAPSPVTVLEGQAKAVWVSPEFDSLRKGGSAKNSNRTSLSLALRAGSAVRVCTLQTQSFRSMQDSTLGNAMPTDISFVEYVTEQSGLRERITHKRMFGEYGIYIDGKVVAFACDNSLFVKAADATAAMTVSLPRRPPYPGAKPYPVADEWLDDSDRLQALLIATATAMPESKAKPPKRVKKKRA